MQDIAQALGSSLDRDGSGGMRAPLDMGGFPVQNAGSGSADSDLATVGQAASAGLPIGSVIDYAGTTAPVNYLLCYGQAISRTDYSDLFAAIGTSFGAGNGSTTFNVPDCRGRVTAGKDNMGGTSANRLTSPLNGDNLAAAGGSESHTLTVAEMPTHSHNGSTGSAGAHDHYVAVNTTSGTDVSGSTSVTLHGTASGDSEYRLRGSPSNATLGKTSSGGSHSHSIVSQGSGDAHNNVQPTIIFNKIIKARAA